MNSQYLNKIKKIYNLITNNKNYNYIKKVFNDNKNLMRSFIKYLRRIKNYTIYKDQYIDENFVALVQLNDLFSNFYPNKVLADGNCFYRTISLITLGDENFFYMIKTVCLFVIMEYKEYFKDLLDFLKEFLLYFS